MYQLIITRWFGRWRLPLKTKVFGWYLRRGVILTKDNLAKRNWHGNKNCVFCHQDETIKHLFFQCRFARSIWLIIQVASDLYPPRSVANIVGNWLHDIDNRFRPLIRVGVLAVIWSLWLCRNDKMFNDKFLLTCRSFTGVPVLFVYGRLFSGRSTETYLRRSMHSWRLRRGILFPNMGGSIIYGLNLHRRRRCCIWSFCHVICRFIFWIVYLWTAVCILAMQRLGVMLKSFSNKAPLSEKKSRVRSTPFTYKYHSN
jgi:hypothetical protein